MTFVSSVKAAMSGQRNYSLLHHEACLIARTCCQSPQQNVFGPCTCALCQTRGGSDPGQTIGEVPEATSLQSCSAVLALERTQLEAFSFLPYCFPQAVSSF